MMLASLLLALVMERPLMFFTDELGRLSQGPLAQIPVQTMRFSTNHVSEAYGVISAVKERELLGHYAYTTNYNCGIPINADDLTFAHLPLIGDDLWDDNGFDFATNRIIRTYRLGTPPLNDNNRGDAMTAWHYAANRMFARMLGAPEHVSSSHFVGNDPPTFGWCTNPWNEAIPERWRDSWYNFACISNNVLAAWGNFQDVHDYNVYNILENLYYLSESDGSYALDGPQWRQYENILCPRRLVCGVMAAEMLHAIPECNPYAITNRTLRLDREFLTAFEAAASLMDTWFVDTGGDSGWDHLWLDHHIEKTWEAVFPSSVSVSVTSAGEYIASVDDFPSDISWNVQEYDSVTTNQTASTEPFDKRPYWRAWMDDVIDSQVNGAGTIPVVLDSSARDTIIAWLDATWPDSSSPIVHYDWNGVAGSWPFTYVGDYSGAPSVDAAQTAARINLRVKATSYGETVQTKLRTYADFAPSDRPPFMYWQSGRVDADVFFQEMMRWTTATNEVRKGESSEINLAGYGGTGTAQYRHRKGFSTQAQTYTVFTNAHKSAAQSLSAECRAKCEALSGVDFSNPMTLAPIPDSIRSEGESRIRQAASGGRQCYAYLNPFNVMKIIMSSGEAVYLLNGTPWTSDRELEVGSMRFILINTSYSSPGDTNVRPAAVQGRQSSASKFRMRFYNLGLPTSN